MCFTLFTTLTSNKSYTGELKDKKLLEGLYDAKIKMTVATYHESVHINAGAQRHNKQYISHKDQDPSTCMHFTISKALNENKVNHLLHLVRPAHSVQMR